MIQLRNLTLARAGKALIESATLQMFAGQKIGLVGANGSGKSSLFALLLGELQPDAGDADVPSRLTIAHVAQQTPAVEQPALDYVLDGDAELRRVESALEAPAADSGDGHELALLYERYEHIGGYRARARAAEILAGLGFVEADAARQVAAFSGGWRVRLNLARALMCRSDLLLLDEPTNHLDLDAVLWLEQWLRGYPGTLLLISHDREFLDNTVSQILHIEGRALRSYAGNYSAFEKQRALALGVHQAAYAKQQREIAHLERFVERFRAKATKARQAQSRLKALARMEEIAPAHVDSPFEFAFREPLASPNPLLVVEHAAAGYARQSVIQDIELSVRQGDRIGLIGPNGAGKSTLVKLLAGELAALSGERREGKGLAVGYFAQHQLEQLRAQDSPLQHLLRLDPGRREQELRDYLGGFNFRGEMATAPVGPFSGGEKSRLALALLIWQRPNLLLLDEPTNHLDLEMRHALTLALQDYEGTLIVVSHDRHLLRTTTDGLWLVADRRVEEFAGDLDDYAQWLDARRGARAAARENPAKEARRERREQQAAQRDSLRAKRRPLRKELEQVERKLAGWQSEKAALDAGLADPALYAEPDRSALQDHLKRQAELAQWITAAEERWLALHEALEQIECD